MKIRLLILLLFFSSACLCQEICNNGIDDDGDAKIDLNDPDCRCNSTPVPSIIPNASFEDHTDCPTSISQLDLCTGWMQATNPTTDYMNTCGAVFEGVTSLSNELMPFPDGEGICGAIFMPDWSEYLGSCLTTPMTANTNYQLTFYLASMPVSDWIGSCNGGEIDYDPINITIYGTRDCVNLPLNTVNSPSAASSEWVELGHVFYSPESRWQQTTISFRPTTNIDAIMIGGPQTLPPSYTAGRSCLPYFLFDDLTLNESAMFGVNIEQTGTFCNNDLVLVAYPAIPVSTSATYQWYREGIAIQGATLPTFPVAATPSNITHYSVRITNGDDCFVGPDFTINAATPAPEITSIQPNCFVPTGTITVSTLSDFYSFDNGATWVTNPVSVPLIPGRYFVKTKTTSGCISVASAINLTDISIANFIDYNFTLPGCNTNGTITILSEGSGYSFDGGLTWGTSNTASLPFGNYNIRMKDAMGCVTGENYAYLQEFYLDYPSISSTQPTCGTGGSITVNTPADGYSFDDGVTWVNSPTANNLAPGAYPVKIKNAAGCTSSVYYEYLYEQFLDIPQIEITPINCASTGTISIITPAAQYSFDGGQTWGTNPLKSNVTEGYYEIFIKNELDCRSYPYGIYMYEELLPAPDVVAIQPACGVAGSISITTPAAEYSFNGGFTWTANPVINNLTDYQFYEIKIKNAQGCISNSYYEGIYPSNDITTIYTDVIQPGSCSAPTGTITITSTASRYSFDDGVTWTTNNRATNLPPGIYKLKVKGFSDCESPTTTITINIPLAAPVPPATVIINPTCTVATGTITVNDLAPFYSYDNGLNWTANNSAVLIPGTYMVKIKDAAGCESAATPSVIRSDTGIPLLPAYNLVQPNCLFIAGIITITSPAEAYSFDDGITWGALNISSPLLPGVYFIKIKNAAGCESDSVRVFITPDIVPVPNVRNVVYCKDLPSLPLSATGSDLLWYLTDVGGTGSAIAPTPPTTTKGISIWYVTQTVNGCESNRAAMSVTVLDNLPPPIVPGTFAYCQNETTNTLYAQGVNLLWYTTQYEGTGSTTAPTPASNMAGTYNYYVSQSAGRCESNRAKIMVVIKPTPLVVTNTNVTYKHYTETEQLTAQGTKLTWYNSSMEQLSEAPKPSSKYIGATTYYVKQTIDDCEGPPEKIIVNIIPNYIKIKYPLYFTPNGDGANEAWNIYNPPFNIKATVFIYDRYGKLITQLTAPGTGWDGTLDGQSLPATDYWFSAFYTEYGVGKEYKSHFSLVR